MKLLTLNCHSWQEKNQMQKIKYIAKIINENDYDVIALQEVSQSIKSKVVFDNIKEDNFALVLQNELIKLGNNKYDFYWDIAHIGYEVYEEGLCLMTKLPILSRESFVISESKKVDFWKTRKVVKIKSLYNNKNVSFLSCHLGWYHDDEPFKYQADSLIDISKDNGLVFAMGDFNNNANIKDEGYDYLSKYFIDTYNIAKDKDNGVTVKGSIAGWDKNKENLRLDIIFANKTLDVKKSSVIFNDINKDTVSDHYGVEVEILNL